MQNNKVKIVSNERTSELAFFFKNERLYWEQVSSANELSRRKYSMGINEEKAKEILQLIVNCFGTGNRVVDILFEGSDKHYDIINKCVSKMKLEEKLNLSKLETGIVVCGKTGTGKTTLIEEIFNRLKFALKKEQFDDYDLYSTSDNRLSFYEIKGIDYSKGAITKAEKTIMHIIQTNVTAMIYCIDTDKIEDSEIGFLEKVKEMTPSIKQCIVMNRSTEEKSNLTSEKIEEDAGVKTIPVLARKMKVRTGFAVEAYGVPDVIDYIFEGE